MDQMSVSSVGSTGWGFYQRIQALRDRTLKLEKQARILISLSALIMSVSSGLMLLAFSGSLSELLANPPGHSPSTGTGPDLIALAVIQFIPVLLTVAIYIGYSIYVLIKAPRTFNARYAHAAQALQQTSLGILLAVEEYNHWVRDSISSHPLLRLSMPLRSNNRFEEHLEFCAAHFTSLEQVARQPGPVPRRMVQLDYNGFSYRRSLQQKPWVYWLAGIVGLFLVGPLIGGAYYITLLGLRQLGNLGVLTAICDFLLADERASNL